MSSSWLSPSSIIAKFYSPAARERTEWGRRHEIIFFFTSSQLCRFLKCSVKVSRFGVGHVIKAYICSGDTKYLWRHVYCVPVHCIASVSYARLPYGYDFSVHIGNETNSWIPLGSRVICLLPFASLSHRFYPFINRRYWKYFVIIVQPISAEVSIYKLRLN